MPYTVELQDGRRFTAIKLNFQYMGADMIALATEKGDIVYIPYNSIVFIKEKPMEEGD